MFVEEKRPRLHKHECANILKEAKKANITTDDMLNAIVAEMYERNLYHITIDIDGREKSYEPPKEMTLSEIEAVLGHKVKIVNEQKEVEETPEAMKTCGRCKYKLNLTRDEKSPCYMCYRNTDDHRLPDNWVKDDE